MSYTEELTRYTANFIDELTLHGLQDVVISPGSRSTPLAVLSAKHKDINDWIIIDERSAAYFALGIAQATGRPVALICTSGTAAANYFPAIVEAYYARVPLIVLTADRPHELRDIGASQTIDQIGMYGSFVKQFYEMAPPSDRQEMLDYARNRALRAIKAAHTNNAGPVHINFPFREPLMPDVKLEDIWNREGRQNTPELYAGKKHISKNEIESLGEFINNHPNGLFVCGPQKDGELPSALLALSKQLNVPILADPLSQLRTGKNIGEQVITTYDTLFRSKNVRSLLKPDYIIRFGGMPISKHYSFFIEEYRHIPQFVVESNEAVREPTNHASHYIIGDDVMLCTHLLAEVNRRETGSDKAWMTQWKRLEQIAATELKKISAKNLTEGTALRKIIEELEDGHHLFIANSMPVRDLDTFLLRSSKHINTYANRGVSGIDGTLSSALGVATKGEPTTLIIGDLSFYHDLNSLLIAKRYELPLTIILINNNGGGIFSFLPQAKEETYFEHLFGTPLDIDFSHAVTMYGGAYELVTNEQQLHDVLQSQKANEKFSVIEIQTDRVENVRWHRRLWKTIAQRLEQYGTLYDDN